MAALAAVELAAHRGTAAHRQEREFKAYVAGAALAALAVAAAGISSECTSSWHHQPTAVIAHVLTAAPPQPPPPL
jgi:hypothetical protein